MEKGKISAFQMGIMMYPTILATAILIVPSITAKYAKNDMWLSPIWASLTGYLTVYLAFRLHRLYPKQTPIQYSERILGKILGKVVGFSILFFYLHALGSIGREYAEFIVGAFLTQTPISLVIATLILLCGFTVRGGVEVIGRSAQLFFPVFVFPLVVMIFLLMPELDPENILPVLEQGMKPSLLGAIVPMSWFSQVFLISFLLPFLTDQVKGKKWGMISVLAVMLTLVITNLIVLFIFGGDTSSMVYPLMAVARYISIADFFENMESAVMAIWVVGAFVKVSVFYYAAALGTAQWLNLSDFRPIVLPLGFLISLISFWDVPNFPELVHYLETVLPFYGTFVQTGIPAFLLLIAVIRNRKRGTAP